MSANGIVLTLELLFRPLAKTAMVAHTGLVLFKLFCCLIEGFFLPFHWGFVFNRIHVEKPYKREWLQVPFPFELVSLIGIHFISEPLRVPGDFAAVAWLPFLGWFNFWFPGIGYLRWWDVVTLLHNAIHIFHTGYVFVKNPPPLHEKTTVLEEWGGRIYVTIDALVHTSTTIRLVLVSGLWSSGFAAIFWLSGLMTLDHRYFLIPPEGQVFVRNKGFVPKESVASEDQQRRNNGNNSHKKKHELAS